MGLTGRTADGSASPSETNNWVDNSLRIGTFGYYGRSPYQLSRTIFLHDGQEIHDAHEAEEMREAGLHVDTLEQLLKGDESFTRVGADFNLFVFLLALHPQPSNPKALADLLGRRWLFRP